MCRGRKSCTELGSDPATWSDECPLPPPPWFESQLDIFESALGKLVTGDREGSFDLLATIRSDEMRDWFVEHGQVSGKTRADEIGLPAPISVEEGARDVLRAPTRFEGDVFARDGYRCRYCGIRLVSRKVLKWFIEAVGGAEFRDGPNNAERHGIVHIAKPYADHVIPWNLGGPTKPENLVASCPACNFGKYHYTVEQLGLGNPMSRPPRVDDWDGLRSRIELTRQDRSLSPSRT